jgi:hypothetical protein
LSIFDTSTLGTSTNQLSFNDYGSFPIYRVISRAPQQRQVRDLDIPIPFESGISDFETLIGRMAYIIEGKMYPSSESDYSTGLAALRKLANLEFEQADTNSDFGYVPYIFTENGNYRQIFLKVVYVDVREDTRQGLIQPFRLVCKIKDPTIYGSPIKVASTQGTNATTSGGAAAFPFTFPVVFGASMTSVTSTAINNGTIPAYPASIVIVGPINTPRVTNTATGEYVEISQNLSSASDVITITYDKDSLSVDLNGNSVLSSVTAASTYFKIHPGNNGITLSGTSIGAAYVVVNYYDSYALS